WDGLKCKKPNVYGPWDGGTAWTGGGGGGCQVSSLRRTAEKWDSVIQSEAELNRQLSQIIICLSEAISIYVKLYKAISSQLFFPNPENLKKDQWYQALVHLVHPGEGV